MNDATRREFLKAAAAGLAAGLSSTVLAQQDNSRELPRRPLGKTGVQVSIICLGGFHIGTLP
ncbi:MAG: twin-arginine translocation signal domain-containing protein, partial [Thermoguttaceae bacterium]|nr:twin-arginine translocation signal domain-containing protein [Thermoguttaceae bacterium]